MDLDHYRDEADRFLAALDEELYLHYAGLKPDLELERIYDRFADLTTLAACRELGEAAATDTRAVELWRFACEGYLAHLVSEDDEESARLEASVEVPVAGEQIPLRMLRPAIANEADRERRQRLDRAREAAVTTHLNPISMRAHERVLEGVTELGVGTPRELYERFGVALGDLASVCTRLLADTEDLYVGTFGPYAERRLGIGLGELARHDVVRLARSPEWDAGFPADRMVPALEATLAELGIDLRAQRNIELDTADRPTKSPRAFCSPIEVPGRVVLVIKPMGGLEDWRALFHEAGHAEHFGHMRASLPVEARRLGDNAITEGFAFLLEHLVDDPAWLRRRLDFGGIDELASEAAIMLLYGVRRYCAKLLYELELLGGGDLTAMPARYRELLFEATKVQPSEADFLGDVDGGFYCTSYLRAWGFEAQLAAHLAAQFGTIWFTRREAGGLLRELWHEGQAMSADEMLDQVTGAPLELAAVAERIAGRIA
jgi:hypothetical protein